MEASTVSFLIFKASFGQVRAELFMFSGQTAEENKAKSLKKEKKGFHICLAHKSGRDGKAEKCSGLLGARASVMVSRMRKHL